MLFFRNRVREIAEKVGFIQPPPFTGINPDQNWIDDDDDFFTGKDSITVYSRNYALTSCVSFMPSKGIVNNYIKHAQLACLWYCKLSFQTQVNKQIHAMSRTQLLGSCKYTIYKCMMGLK